MNWHVFLKAREDLKFGKRHVLNLIVFVISDKLNIFHIAKRTPPYSHWEPIYIGTHSDPYYDERLTWEGRSDKMTQVIYPNLT